ncbi:hypothetical protein T4C_6624 [Trichinella pseudospiralis]|uniref:Uncharacterized protein n=1 Tax=Trichinella pseudospiralis TaxID=6337 RepID=A0A0V1JMQ0_TRIPS|nr:hypothetical protein T4C_6624 [Trichinella pseudospiralis]
MSSVFTLCCPLQLVTFISTQRTTIDMEMTTISTACDYGSRNLKAAFLKKYCYVISPLPDSVAADVDDLPLLFRITCYETSKRRLFDRYRESDDDFIH